MKENKGIIIGIIIIILVVGTLFLYLLNINEINISEMTPFGIILLLIGFAMYILWDRIKNLQKGFPIKDERLILVNYKAGYYAFITAIWSAVGGPLIADILFDHELEGHAVTMVVVLISGFVFVSSYLYLSWKGTKP